MYGLHMATHHSALQAMQCAQMKIFLFDFPPPLHAPVHRHILAVGSVAC